MALYQVKLIEGVESLPAGSSVLVKSEVEYEPYMFEVQDAFNAEYDTYLTMADLNDNIEIVKLF